MRDWLSLLRAEVARTNTVKAARRVGCARSAVSMALAGKYPAATDSLAAKVMAVLGRVACPLAGDITASDCADSRARPMPSGSRQAFRAWRVCQSCTIGGGSDAQP